MMTFGIGCIFVSETELAGVGDEILYCNWSWREILYINGLDPGFQNGMRADGTKVNRLNRMLFSDELASCFHS